MEYPARHHFPRQSSSRPPMLTMFADILYLTHHLVHKLFYKQITETGGVPPEVGLVVQTGEERSWGCTQGWQNRGSDT